MGKKKKSKLALLLIGFILLSLFLWFIFQSQTLPDKGKFLSSGMSSSTVKFLLGSPDFENNHLMFWSAEQGKIIRDLSDVNMTMGSMLFFKDGELANPRLLKTTQDGVWEAYCYVFDVSLKEAEMALGERPQYFNQF